MSERGPTTIPEARLKAQGQWPTTSHPRSCCLVCPETAHDHGHAEPGLYGEDDALAAKALLGRALAALRAQGNGVRSAR
jgi:hypothetical protein